MRAFTAAGEHKENTTPGPLTTKGDLVVHDGVDAQRLPVGVDGQSLLADSTQANGVKWGTPAAVPADDSITFAKIQNIPTDTLIGRDSASTGDPESIGVTGGVEFDGAGNIRTSAFTGDVTKAAGGTATTIAAGAVTDTKVAAANKDGAAATPSMRTLGTGAAQACAGNDSRLSDDRTASGLRTATTVVAVSSAAAPTAGQVLTATAGNAASWQTPASGGAPTVRALGADVSNSTTTGAKITGLDVASLAVGTYVFQYFIRAQSAATTTGHKFGVNFTGTTTAFVATMRAVGTGTTAVSGTIDGVASSGQIVEGYATRTEQTTAPNLGPSTAVDTANADVLYIIEGILIVGATGTLELWHASEVAAASTVKDGSSLILTKTG